MFLQNTMANPFDNYSSSSSHAEQDEISLFLQQILLRSSSPSALIRRPSQCSVSPCDHIVAENQEPEMGSFPGRVSEPDPCSGLNSSTGCWVPANVSSSYVGTFDNDPDEYDCESEEGVEVVADEAAQKRTAARNSSKRSRAAEVHNLSEKRRRSRINEKMKALQNLIPNSNKTDKASMLDEAIEYLKQLQLQVQMLTLRNGLSLYPICLPGMMPPDHISHTRADILERNISLSTEKGITMDQDISADTLLNLQNHYVKQAPSVASFSTTLGSKTILESESSFQNHLEPIQFSRSCAGVCRDELLPCQQPNNEWCPTTLPGHFGTRKSNLKDHTIEACLGGGGTDKLPNLLHNTIFSSQLKNSENGGRPPFDDIKTEGDGF